MNGIKFSFTNEIFIIENNIESRSEFSEKGFGNSNAILTFEHIQALNVGKGVAIYNGEYTTIISLQNEED